MNFRKIIALILICSAPFCALAQEPVKADTLIKKLDSLAKKTDSAGVQKNNINPAAYNDVTKLTPKSYFILLGSDIKQEFTKPFHMKRKDWGNLGKFALVELALGFADEPIQRNALALRNKSAGVRNVGGFITHFGGVYEFAALGGFGLYGILAKSDKVKTTTLLATQSVITAVLAEAVIKTLAGRTRPNYYPETVEAEPKFLGPLGKTGRAANGTRSNSSFPSGHTTAAFSAATVFAIEYKNKPYIPIIAYSAATLVGLSRITENKHWATDVVAGAALGYLNGRQVSFNYHRYAKIKNGEKNKVAFNLSYDFGKLMPGLVWKL